MIILAIFSLKTFEHIEILNFLMLTCCIIFILHNQLDLTIIIDSIITGEEKNYLHNKLGI